MQTALITGAHGFIGQALSRRLQKEEIKVVAIPRPMLYNLVELHQFLFDHQPTLLIHAAAYGNLYQQNNDLECVYANVISTINLLEASRDIPYQAGLFFSSSSVGLPYETFYSATKAGAERIVRAFVNKYHKPFFSVRPFTVIGPHAPDGHLLPTLIRSCLTGTEMPFVGDPVHDYIDVDDLVSSILLLLPHAAEFEGNMVEIGTGIGTSNDQLKKTVEKVIGKKANTKPVSSLRPYDTHTWVAKTAVLDYLHFVPRYGIEQTVRRILQAG